MATTRGIRIFLEPGNEGREDKKEQNCNRQGYHHRLRDLEYCSDGYHRQDAQKQGDYFLRCHSGRKYTRPEAFNRAPAVAVYRTALADSGEKR